MLFQQPTNPARVAAIFTLPSADERLGQECLNYFTSAPFSEHAVVCLLVRTQDQTCCFNGAHYIRAKRPNLTFCESSLVANQAPPECCGNA